MKRLYYCNNCGKEQKLDANQKFKEGCSNCEASWIHLKSGHITEEEKQDIEIKKLKERRLNNVCNNN